MTAPGAQGHGWAGWRLAGIGLLALGVTAALYVVGASGSFTIRKVIANRPGPDKIHARATFGNHTCGGAVTL